MKTRLSAFIVAAALALGASATTPASAASAAGLGQGAIVPLTTSAPTVGQAAEIQEVQYRPRRGDRYRDHRWRDRGYRDHRYRGPRYNPGPGIYFEFNAPPRRYVQPRYVPPRRGLSRAHYSWCEGRYRSYRAYDNTYQPYNGPRRACVSPFY